jgi:hypothetical protein
MRLEHRKLVESLERDLNVIADSVAKGETTPQDLKFPQTSTRLAQVCAMERLPLSTASDFIRSKSFGAVTTVKLHNALYAFLQEAASNAIAQGASRFEWAFKHRNDLVDLFFIAAYSSYVTDIFVDNFCGELLRKREVRAMTGDVKVWTPKTRDAFEEAVDGALSEVEFLRQEQAYKCAVGSDLSRRVQTEANVMRAETRKKILMESRASETTRR